MGKYYICVSLKIPTTEEVSPRVRNPDCPIVVQAIYFTPRVNPLIWRHGRASHSQVAQPLVHSPISDMWDGGPLSELYRFSEGFQIFVIVSRQLASVRAQDTAGLNCILQKLVFRRATVQYRRRQCGKPSRPFTSQSPANPPPIGNPLFIPRI
jgi:hypothetical protein